MTTEPTYRRGDSGPAVAAIRERLARLGLIDAGAIPAQGEPVFDEAAVNDTATYRDPHQFPIGIPFVVVNGSVAVDHERCTGFFAGQAVP